MNFDLSTFDQIQLKSLTICCSLEDSEKASELKDSPFYGDCRLENGGWLHIKARPWLLDVDEADDEDVHFHMEFVRSFPDSKLQASNDRESLLAIAEMFIDKDAFAICEGTFILENQSFSKKGLIRPFLGMTTTAGGFPVSLTGSSFRIKDTHFKEVSWTELKDSSIQLTISSHEHFKITHSIFSETVRRLQEGMHRVVNGRQNEVIIEDE